MITTAQADTIVELEARGFLSVGFHATEAFPHRNNADNGRRRTLRGMVNKGLLAVSEDGRYYVPSREHLVEAYQEWARAHDWKDPSEI